MIDTYEMMSLASTNGLYFNRLHHNDSRARYSSINVPTIVSDYNYDYKKSTREYRKSNNVSEFNFTSKIVDGVVVRI